MRRPVSFVGPIVTALWCAWPAGGTPAAKPPPRCRLLVFVAHDCPVSNAYASELESLFRAYRNRGVAFELVYAEEGISEQRARAHGRSFGLHGPHVLDGHLRMAHRYGVTVTPEACVVSVGGKLLYRGRIDDRYVDLGQQRRQPWRHDLRRALDDVLAGRTVKQARTSAVGCFIQ